MAELDIRVDVDFCDHPKTKRLIRRLGPEGVICLLRLWCFAAQHHPDGVLRGMDAEAIADAAGWTGDASSMLDAMLTGLRSDDATSKGFIERDPDGTYRLHDWVDHQPYIADYVNRSERARHAAQARWRKKFGYKEHAFSMQDVQNGNAGSMLPPSIHPYKDLKNTSPPAPPVGSVDIVDKPKKPRQETTGPTYSAEFLQFWTVYPRKVGKGAAWRAWQNAKGRPAVAELIAAIERAKRTEQWQKEHGRFIPHPATWLNQRRWEDEPESDSAANIPPRREIKLPLCGCRAGLRAVKDEQGRVEALVCQKCGQLQVKYDEVISR